MKFEQYHADVRARIDYQLEQHINSLPEQASPLADAMKYALLSNGKRVRPLLMAMVAEMLNVSFAKVLNLACAMECIHAYSLVHDDLPAMDDDDLRRGQPTCHILFDEGMAILAGDALQTMAFEIVVNDALLIAEEKINSLRLLTNASGYAGMCGGQAIDLTHTNQQIDVKTLTELHQLKTGALLQACVSIPMALAEGMDESAQKALLQFAQKIGLAFQVQDDILDVTGDSATLGKPSGSDEEANKSTFPALLGLSTAQNYLDKLYSEALTSLKQLPYHTDPLRDFAQYIIKRNY